MASKKPLTLDAAGNAQAMQIGDVVDARHLPDVSVRVYQSTATTLTDDVWTTVAFDIEQYDTADLHGDSHNSRITFVNAGKYRVGGCVNVSASRTLGCRIVLNGTTVIEQRVQGSAGGPEGCGIATEYVFAANDYVELQGLVRSGAADTSGDRLTNFYASMLAILIPPPIVYVDNAMVWFFDRGHETNVFRVGDGEHFFDVTAPEGFTYYSNVRMAIAGNKPIFLWTEYLTIHYGYHDGTTWQSGTLTSDTTSAYITSNTGHTDCWAVWDNGSTIKASRFNGAGFDSPMTVATRGANGSAARIAVSQDGLVHVVWSELTTGYHQITKLSTYNGTSWSSPETVIADSAGMVDICPAGSGKKAAVLYQDLGTSNWRIAEWSGTEWTLTTVATITETAGWNLVLAFVGGVPSALYFDGSSDNFKFCQSPSWTHTTITYTRPGPKLALTMAELYGGPLIVAMFGDTYEAEHQWVRVIRNIGGVGVNVDSFHADLNYATYAPYGPLVVSTPYGPINNTPA